MSILRSLRLSFAPPHGLTRGMRSGLSRKTMLISLCLMSCGEQLMDHEPQLGDGVQSLLTDFQTTPTPAVCGGDSTVPVVAPSPPVTNAPRTPTVFTVAQLAAAAARTTRTDIVLANGEYRAEELAGAFLTLGAGHRLLAQERGRVTLKFGVLVGGTADRFAGAQLHGLRFDIDALQHAAQAGQDRAAVVNWGSARNLGVYDCTFDGHSVVHAGIAARQPDGLVVQRSVIRQFLRYGILADSTTESGTLAASITDVVVDGVGDATWPPPGGAEGAQEHGISIGNAANLRRIRIRNVAQTGIMFRDEASDCTAADIDIDRIGVGNTSQEGGGVGVYFERITQDSWLWRFCIGAQTRIGVVSEWDHNLPAHSTPLGARGLRNTVSLGSIASTQIGVWFDQGTVDSHVSRIGFRNQSWAAIGMYHNVASELEYPETQQNPPVPTTEDYENNVGGSQWDNTFDGAALCNFTRSHWRQAAPVCVP